MWLIQFSIEFSMSFGSNMKCILILFINALSSLTYKFESLVQKVCILQRSCMAAGLSLLYKHLHGYCKQAGAFEGRLVFIQSRETELLHTLLPPYTHAQTGTQNSTRTDNKNKTHTTENNLCFLFQLASGQCVPQKLFNQKNFSANAFKGRERWA